MIVHCSSSHEFVINSIHPLIYLSTFVSHFHTLFLYFTMSQFSRPSILFAPTFCYTHFHWYQLFHAIYRLLLEVNEFLLFAFWVSHNLSDILSSWLFPLLIWISCYCLSFLVASVLSQLLIFLFVFLNQVFKFPLWKCNYLIQQLIYRFVSSSKLSIFNHCLFRILNHDSLHVIFICTYFVQSITHFEPSLSLVKLMTFLIESV